MFSSNLVRSVRFLTVLAIWTSLTFSSSVCLAQAERNETLTAIDEAIAADNYDDAQKLIAQGNRAARAARDADLQHELQDLRRRVGQLRDAFGDINEDVATLRQSPQDQAANTAVGRFYCLEKGDWEQGLPLLARGDDEALRDAARLDLSKPEDVVRQVAIGDAWKKLAEDLREAGPRERLQLRARFWLLQALEKSDGMAQAEIERRLDALELYPNRIVIWNAHNGHHNDRGTLAARVVLINGQEPVWQKDIVVPWVKDVPVAATVWLPRKQCDQVRVEVQRWYMAGGGLAEVEVYYGNEKLSENALATASGSFDARFGPDRVTDGKLGETVTDYEGYWLLPDKEPGWVQIHLNRR